MSYLLLPPDLAPNSPFGWCELISESRNRRGQSPLPSSWGPGFQCPNLVRLHFRRSPLWSPSQDDDIIKSPQWGALGTFECYRKGVRERAWASTIGGNPGEPQRVLPALRVFCGAGKYCLALGSFDDVRQVESQWRVLSRRLSSHNLCFKINTPGPKDVDQSAECLPSMHLALSLILSPT